MYRLFEAAAAMRLTSGCHARCSSFVLKSREVPSAGATGAAAAASGPPPGLAAAPFCSAARFALLPPLDSPNLPCDCTQIAREDIRINLLPLTAKGSPSWQLELSMHVVGGCCWGHCKEALGDFCWEAQEYEVEQPACRFQSTSVPQCCKACGCCGKSSIDR